MKRNSYIDSELIELGYRHCFSCSQTKSIDDFYMRGKKKDGSAQYSSSCSECTSNRAVKWTKANPEDASASLKRTRRSRRFGMTADDWQRMFEFQEGVCAICHKPETVVKNGRVISLSVDHDHDTGLVRGLLCLRCNQGLGAFGDDPLLLLAAVQYLHDHWTPTSPGHIWKTTEEIERMVCHHYQ